MRGCRREVFAAVALTMVAALTAAAPALARTTPRHAPADASTDADSSPEGAQAPETADTALLDIESEPSGVAARLAAWVTASNDNDGLPFMIVDKLAANVFAFDADGELTGHAPVLVGLARGDDSAPGIGQLKLSAISPDQRTTPAGRFVAHFGPSDGHGQVLWVDYADAISMHPVITTNPKEHRLRRIASASPDEHRISFGCINVPAKFYRDVVQKDRDGVIVYVLPDTKPLADFFPAFTAADGAGWEDEPGSRSDRCDDPRLDFADRVADSDPAHVCAVDDDGPAVAGSR